MIKVLKNVLLALWYFLSSLIVIGVIISIFAYILIKGLSVINLNFILQAPKGTPLGIEGGILPAIIGSLALTAIACISASILGVATAVYLSLYCTHSVIKELMHLVISSISGIPSIVLGLFGYSFLVYFCDLGISLIAGGITLGIMIFPYVEVVTEKSIMEVDKSLIVCSYSLGVSKSYTFFRIILPSCASDIISGTIMSGGFAMGAAAPVMLTSAVVSAPNPDSLLSPVMALPYHLYILVSQGISMEKAYGTSLVLVILLIVINFAAAILTKRRKV
ncbi:phosphate ABC transporter permease PstA [Clostridium sp. A1-XYC3]|uniref:Phosphate transport system permease protein PstA n=1 Tax=Clostridium tanneri TaxID=3037988 RepID=A0ABU4JQY3_9CLOT|nr:phosphate ABC transporter permease PstA [Clostridium sp. A1-XYC3]MDW8800561.1 phosphate ABC transporter permease PstA [Clostridium sp. A1-XYC3]